MRTEYGSGLGLEEKYGYSRAVAVGDALYTSATAPVDAELRVIGANAYDQAVHAFSKLEPVFEQAGFQLVNTVLARVYLVDTADLDDVGRAIHDTFTPSRPALTVVHIGPYGLPELRLEVELVAHRAGPVT
jgi:enamine deaminase RidA (YjgF/YER057c/UK114 family)